MIIKEDILFSKKRRAMFIALLFVFNFLPFFVSADSHRDEGYFTPIIDFNNLENDIRGTSFNALIVTSAIVTIIVVISLFKTVKSELLKRLSFSIIAGSVLATTIFMAVSTVYLNKVSSTGGPVHWHADFKIFACGQEIDLIDPKGLSNRIGTPVFHEHGDNRIHVEGVVLKQEDISLKSFFEVIGGSMSKSQVTFPTNEGLVSYSSGFKCPNNSPMAGQTGQWQVFVYKTNPETKEVRQEKIIDFENYILSPYGVVPPADCIIMEFTSEEKNKTNEICNFYQIELNKGNIRME